MLAPTGTIAFMMDCDTTGVEPDIALVKYKQLAGGGMLKIVNRTVPMALGKLGYDDPEDPRHARTTHRRPRHDRGGDPGLKTSTCPSSTAPSLRRQGGTRSIHYQGHLRMMAAVQPFLSGAISKTVNMPRDATVADIRHAYLEGWKLGLKALAIYRDGSKESQPVSTQVRGGQGPVGQGGRQDRRREGRRALAIASPARELAPAVVSTPAARPSRAANVCPTPGAA